MTMNQRLRPDLFHLDPAVAHLNHGSFGAVPIPVLEAQRRESEAIERSPERFYREDLAPAMDAVRTEVAGFMGTDPDGLALVENATTAVQVALDAVDLGPGAEVVLTDHAYGWVRAAVNRACERYGAVARVVRLPAGAATTGEVTAEEAARVLLAALEPAITGRTKLLILDQVTSASALRLPVEEVCDAVGDDVPVLIDGAHAPGLLEEPVPRGAAFWLGNLHKWAFAARTAAALVVAPSFRDNIEPLVASAGAADGFPRSFSYLGTQDPSAYLALPASLSFPEEHLGLSFPELRRRNVRVLDAGLALLAERTGLMASADNGLPMRTVSLGREGDDGAAAALAASLRQSGVEAAITSLGGRLLVRASVQTYVAPEDFARLADALLALGFGRA